MAASPKWQFKTKFRANAYGWRGSKLAITRLKDAVKEIRAVAKADPVAAGDGCVALMERLWPALQHIDTSSGALGTAVHNALEDLIPLLIAAPADRETTAKWLERLFDAVQQDGVDYLGPVAERWGEIARYPDLVNQYADMLLDRIRDAWAGHQRYNHVIGSAICLSCLLEAGRYNELRSLLALRRHRFWSDDRFAAAKDAGFLDIAISCAAATDADPATLVRAARDFAGKQPEFAMAVGVLAIRSLLSGGGYEPLLSESASAVRHIMAAAASIGVTDWAIQQIGLALQQPCVKGREVFRDSGTAELGRQQAQART
jgi:hypothetical protein